MVEHIHGKDGVPSSILGLGSRTMAKTKLFIFDLDDTLIATNSIFKRKMHEASSLLSTKLNEPESSIFSQIEQGLSNARPTQKVNPIKLWAHALDSLQNSFPKISFDDRKRMENLLFQIYKEVPDVFEGAFELLQKIKEEKIQTAILSHAETEWTHFKLKSTGLSKYFDSVHTANVDQEKTSANWQSVVDNSGFSNNECAVIGDNITGDIISASKIGIKKLVWFDNKDNWSVHRHGDLPEGTIIVKDLKEVTSLLDCGQL